MVGAHPFTERTTTANATTSARSDPASKPSTSDRSNRACSNAALNTHREPLPDLGPNACVATRSRA